MSGIGPDASGSKANDDPRHHHLDGFAAGTASANDTRATSAELDREGEQATKRKRSRITQACRRCKTVSWSADSLAGEFSAVADPARIRRRDELVVTE